ncbi:MAG: hypothetical protein HYV63_03300 [Candidatus Schekmanbacteria bacterium]|nr:hypothetical protein [Candidatus Schekmanbacteria bacterium]
MLAVLQARFGAVPAAVIQQVERLDRLPVLDALLRDASIATSVVEFQEVLAHDLDDPS